MALNILPARRLERIIKEVLDEIGEDKGELKRLLTGRIFSLLDFGPPYFLMKTPLLRTSAS